MNQYSQVVTHIIAQKVCRERTRRDTKRNKTFSRKRTCFYFSPLFYDTTEERESWERERERNDIRLRRRCNHRSDASHAPWSQKSCWNWVITSSPKFSFLSRFFLFLFLSLSLSLSLCIQKELSRGHRDTKKNAPSLSLFLLAQTVSLNHISIYHGETLMLCIVIIAISAGSRVLARVFRARKTRIPRAQSLFFCISFTGNVWLNCLLLSWYFFV